VGERKTSQTHRFPVGGVILVFLGVVLLLQNFDVLPWGLWGTLWRFWPVILVIIGINLLVSHRNPWLAGVLVLAILGACLGLAIWQYHSSYPPGKISETYLEPLDGLQGARVEIDFKAGVLHLLALPPNSANLVEATSKGDGLKADFRRKNEEGHLYLTTAWGHRRPWRGAEWEVKLCPDIPLTIKIDSAAANLRLDLSQLEVTDFDLEINAGNCKVDMPYPQQAIQASVKANAANVEIIIPEEVAARIETETNVSALEIAEGRFSKKGNYYISPDFEEAESRIYLKIDSNAGKVEIK